MVVVDGDSGPDISQTQPSYIWSFGLLGAMKKLLEAEYESLRNARSKRELDSEKY